HRIAAAGTTGRYRPWRALLCFRVRGLDQRPGALHRWRQVGGDMAASVTDYLRTHRERIVAELIEFAGISSVSTDSAYADGMAAAATWVAAQLRKAGVRKVQILSTARHPVVYGEWLD